MSLVNFVSVLGFDIFVNPFNLMDRIQLMHFHWTRFRRFL